MNTLSCPGCRRRTAGSSRPTPLVDELTSTHELADGTRVLVRPLLYSDRPELAEAYRKLSTGSRRLRFFAAPDELSDSDLEYLTNLDYENHFAFAAFALDTPGCPGVGVARYVRDAGRPSRAEAAVTVLDAFQHRGLGSLLLLLLAEQARRHGVTTFVSYALWDNLPVLEGLEQAGGRIEPTEPGVARIELDIPEEPRPRQPWVRAALENFAARLLVARKGRHDRGAPQRPR